jgi:hypothetical protein
VFDGSEGAGQSKIVKLQLPAPLRIAVARAAL